MPAIVERTAQRYVAERATVTIPEFPRIADRLPPLIGTLAANGVALAGAPFFRYRVLHPGMRFTVEAGVPVDGGFEAEDPAFADELPAGRYGLDTYVGAPDGLAAATASVLEWGAAEGIDWDRREGPDGEEWGCRLEVLRSNPLEVPDPAQWVTDLLFRIAD
ncbi:GyrI-like domain-containing protein [Amycolatopsis sp. SID8362]|uniref:GyrI-like domain-containing protein n=1 Tax=Amycolatopsis sp. SID8362 TaxID=2690346 RepID=UPI0013693AE1|nr:GyrI-like domain-containing protein [Amycolatopsis sp. SID8362]NBH11041.1 AraC family transcriptional regulator [Amycolatopsis sp. SID8362]NED47732.1 GyrI-like domain-containing protein [Amycolatopsis sp. SID8362]